MVGAAWTCAQRVLIGKTGWPRCPGRSEQSTTWLVVSQDNDVRFEAIAARIECRRSRRCAKDLPRRVTMSQLRARSERGVHAIGKMGASDRKYPLHFFARRYC